MRKTKQNKSKVTEPDYSCLQKISFYKVPIADGSDAMKTYPFQ